MAVHTIRPTQYNDLSTATFSMSSELNYEDITLIWMDENVNENFDCLDTKCRLNIIVNYLKVFDNAQETIDYVRSAVNEHLFLIVSGSLGENVVSQISNEYQLKFIYVFCMNREEHSQWTCQYEKISGIFIDKYEMFHHLTTKVRIYEKSLTTMSIFNRTQMISEENSTRDYMIDDNITLAWLELFIDILLRLPLDRNAAKQDMIAECRLYYKNNALEMKKIDEFESDYSPETSIHWYTRDSFVYRLVNKALRTFNVDIIFKFRFLIIDLYQQLKQRHLNYIESIPTIDPKKIIHTVYRSQHMSVNEIEKLRTSIGELICPNSFFSTTEDYMLSRSFVAGSDSTECVLFQIDIPDSYYCTIHDALQYTRPFFKLENLSQFQSEKEIIFSMGALFRIESIEQHDMWYVSLKFEPENDVSGKDLCMSEELEGGKHDWQNRCSVEDRILLLSDKLPSSFGPILTIYIKYGIFVDKDATTSAETLTTYRKGFELIMRCIPDCHFLITIAMHLSIGLLYCNRGERILATHCGEAALQIAETHLSIDHECALICYNYLAVIHQIDDQCTEALSTYEKMLSIANEHHNPSALLAIYESISLIVCDFEDANYELICLQKIAELQRKLGCENKAATNFDFGYFYEKKQNFIMALYYYKQHLRNRLQQKAPTNELTKAYFFIGKIYENLNYDIAALQIYVRILVENLMSVPFYDRSVLRKYSAVIKWIRRLIKCNRLKKLRYYFRLLMSSPFSSIVFGKFINKIKFLFYFQVEHSIKLKRSLKTLLKRILEEYHNQKMYGNTLKKLQQIVQRLLALKPACFARIYCNTLILRKLQYVLNDYRRFLHLVQRAHFSNNSVDIYDAKKIDASVEACAKDIGRAIFAFTHSSHATLCQDRIPQKPRQRHRSLWMYQYRSCGCYKKSFTLHCRSTGRWARFSQI